jgi:hypothetical protein
MHLINIYIFTSSPEYDRAFEYEKYRSGFTDFKKYKYNKTFEDLGISINDYMLMSRFMGIDSPPLNLENLEKLKSVSVLAKWRIRKGLGLAYLSFKNPFSLLLLVILFCGCLISRQVRVISAVCIASIVAIAIYTCRMKYRICLPVLAMGTIISTIFIQSELKEGTPQIKEGFYSLFFLVFISAIYLTAEYQHKTLDTRITRLKRSAHIWEFCEKENINSVVYWVTAIPGGNKRMFFSGNRLRGTRLHVVGGWGGSYPKRLKKLREIYGQDIYGGLARPGTYHLFPRNKKAVFETFVKEHGPKKVEPTVLLETNDTVLFLIEDKQIAVR